MRMERKWTPAQKSAIDTRDCNVLVSAAAGSGKTQEQVAEAVGLEPGTISRIERGVKGMSIDSLLMFSEIYGVSTDYILKGDETMTPSDALLEELGALVQKYKSL